MFFDEEMLLDFRLNYLNDYVDKFVVVESSYTHSGEKRKLLFDINKFKQYKDKISYIVVDKEPNGISKVTTDDSEQIKNAKYILNAAKRENFQRNSIQEGLIEADSKDLILISDVDEIPNLEKNNLNNIKNKIILFKQKLFYYKFNLLYEKLLWYGTRACKKKDLPKFEILRLIKPKKYPFYRLDTFFKNNKRMDIQIIKNGGWHYTRVLSPEDIHQKELIAEHHDEYKLSKKNPEKIADLIKRRVIDHNHFVDSTENKYGKEFKLKQLPVNDLPEYISQNIDKYKKFLDLD